MDRQTGYAAAELIGQTSRLLKSGEHEQHFYEDLWDMSFAGQVFRANFLNHKKTGERYHEGKTISPLKDEHGQISHFVSTGKDITDRIRADERNLVKITKSMPSREDIFRLVSCPVPD